MTKRHSTQKAQRKLLIAAALSTTYDEPNELAAIELFISTPDYLYCCRGREVVLFEVATGVIPFKYAHA